MMNKEAVIEKLKEIEDPELHIDIWTLKLIYDIAINDKKVDIKMTFTSPMCPFGPALVEEVRGNLEKLGFEDIVVDVVFDPPWQPSDEVKEMLGLL